jgi:hypothetical protein
MKTDILTEIILGESDNVEDITEVHKTTTRSSDRRSTKIKRAAGQMATYEGRRKSDPLYNKMIQYRDLYYKYRDLLKRKYRAKNVNNARR